MFVNISIKSIIKNKLFILLFCILLIVIAIIICTCSNRLILGEKIADINPFEVKSYYCEYDLTAVSNKNVNTYFIKEWFNSGKYKIEFLDKMNNVVHIIINEDKIYINNINEKNKLIFNKLNYANNIISFSTLINIYNCVNNIENTCDCSIAQYVKDDKITAYIQLDKTKKCECNICTKLINNNVSEIILELDKTNKKPLGFTTYDIDKNIISSIVYTKFEMNIEIEDKLFIIP